MKSSFDHRKKNTWKIRDLSASQEGSALVIAVLILCILTILGIASTNTSTIDLQIAANDRDYVQEFYVADSGWKEAVFWLHDQVAPANKVNTSAVSAVYDDAENAVRNFGDGGTDVTNAAFPDGTHDDTIDGINYWYNLVYETDEVELGSGSDYRRFTYTATSVADKTQQIEVELSKVYKVGY